MTRVDVLVVGQGLAGTVLAWKLLERGKSVRIIDPGLPVTSSKIAAGLITPILGQRLTPAADWDLFWPEARHFYRQLETTLQASLLRETGAARWFQSAEEQTLFQTRLAAGAYAGLDVELCPVPSTQINAPWGGFSMPSAARLSVPHFLRLSRQKFAELGLLIAEEFREADLFLEGNGAVWKDCEARHVLFCRGAQERHSLLFNEIDFRPAKGEILRLHIPTWSDSRTHHHGVWLAEQSPGEVLCGSTYTWDEVDLGPTPQGKAGLESRLKNWLTIGWSLLDHQAAVRPSVADTRPVIGRHSIHSQLAILNGLGARGSLWSPLVANWLLDELYEDSKVPPEFHLSRWRARSGV